MASSARIAVITGAGMGIGQATALRLVRDGMRVAMIDLDENALAETAQAIGAAGGESYGVVADMLDQDAIADAFGRIAASFGPVDVLVNNVGQSARERAKPFWEGDPAIWNFTIDICLRSAMISTGCVLPGMRERKYGRIVNLSSEAAFLGTDITVDYGAAKAGIIGFTRTLSRSVAPAGITVNAVCPGFVRTRVMDKLPPELVQKAVSEIPIGFVAEPEDIAATIAFFASEQSRFITGQSLLANGGKWMI
jgi:acetoacetyl-CoA reductase/3-oxoacyl-[acyl-carrier protein] reductase